MIFNLLLINYMRNSVDNGDLDKRNCKNYCLYVFSFFYVNRRNNTFIFYHLMLFVGFDFDLLLLMFISLSFACVFHNVSKLQFS